MRRNLLFFFALFICHFVNAQSQSWLISGTVSDNGPPITAPAGTGRVTWVGN